MRESVLPRRDGQSAPPGYLATVQQTLAASCAPADVVMPTRHQTRDGASLALRQHDKGTTTTQCPDREATKSHRRTRKPSGTNFSDFQFFRFAKTGSQVRCCPKADIVRRNEKLQHMAGALLSDTNDKGH